MRFGIHPFGFAGMASGIAQGKPDNFSRLPGIIDELRGGRPFLLRIYVPFAGSDSIATALSMVKMVAASGASWDVVLVFKFDGDDLSDWLELIRLIVLRFGNSLDSLQITSEPNLRGMPDAGDGCRPHIMRALHAGVLTAKSTARASNASVSIGFNAVPTFDERDSFWPAIREFGEDFRKSLDYVGLDFYPDVFGPPLALEHIQLAVQTILRNFRNHDLAASGLPATLPIRICENGWPTGPNRSYERQAAALEAVIRAVHAVRLELNITHYEMFGLRDADSGNPNSFYQFGIMNDDYNPKPAFEMYKQLIQELGA